MEENTTIEVMDVNETIDTTESLDSTSNESGANFVAEKPGIDPAVKQLGVAAAGAVVSGFAAALLKPVFEDVAEKSKKRYEAAKEKRAAKKAEREAKKAEKKAKKEEK